MRDRVVQTAQRMVIEPIFEHRFAEHRYGFRTGRGCKDALRRVMERIADSRVLTLIRIYLEQGVMEELAQHAPTERGRP